VRRFVPILAAFAALASACSSSGSGASGTGGIQGSGGAGTGGTPATGGAPATGGVSGTGGSGADGGTSGTGGMTATGGTKGTGGATATGGTKGTGGAGGTGATGGTSGAGGMAGHGGDAGSMGGTGVSQSAGCGKTRTLQNGTITLTANGAPRNYILHTPSGYDDTHPYRLVLAYAWSGGSSTDVANSNYFTFSTMDSQGTIFVAPNASDGAGTWSNADVAFTDTILAQVEGDLCVDKTRVFASGFSFGGAMAIALACTRADVFRGVAFFSGADLTNSCPTTLTKPIAYYASQASQDRGSLPATSPIAGEVVQANFAAVNGCTAVPASTTYPASGQPHTCTIYQGCSAGHPTEYCVFNGPHGWEPTDPGQTKSWDPPEAWKFITQF
jgi:poly(3-hydroxybutyrate) depolymerase